VRLLYVSMTLPAPPDNGHRLRTWLMLRALAAEGHELTLLAFAAKSERGGDTSPLRALCREVEVVPLTAGSLTSRSGYAGRLRALLAGTAYAARRYRSEEMARRVGDHLARGRFDALVVDTAFGMVNVPPTTVPLLLNNVDIEHVILERYAAFERHPLKRAYARLEARRLREFEAVACRRADVCMPCSPVDEAALQGLVPGLRTVVVPNVVDDAEYAPAATEDEEVVLYQGGLDWYPNRDAVRYFAGEVLPRLRRLRPNVRFVVAGRNPTPRFRRSLEAVPGLELSGTVPDMRPVLGRATVCVVPLRIGSGTRIKILEAAAMAKPVVSTRLGAEGLAFADGREIMLEDEAQPFAEAVAGLLADPRRREALGRAARARVQSDYSLGVLRRQLARAIERVVVTPWEGAAPVAGPAQPVAP
jgi:glycosyltransferase involved in cell wall biosynthesis